MYMYKHTHQSLILRFHSVEVGSDWSATANRYFYLIGSDKQTENMINASFYPSAASQVHHKSANRKRSASGDAAVSAWESYSNRFKPDSWKEYESRSGVGLCWLIYRTYVYMSYNYNEWGNGVHFV